MIRRPPRYTRTATPFPSPTLCRSQPTLTLLHQRQAPVVVTIFRAAFGRDNKPIPTARLHTLVDQHVAEMRRNGATDVPAGTGKELCQDRKSTRLNSSH